MGIGRDGLAGQGLSVGSGAAVTATTNANFFRMGVVSGAAVTIPSGTANHVATMSLFEPNITATGTVTNASTLRIANAPSEGTNNYALFVDAGTSRFDGDIFISDGAGILIGHTAKLSLGGQTPDIQILGTGGTDTATIFGRFSADSGPFTIDFVKSRAAIGSIATVLDNDKVGRFRFFPDDGTDLDTEAAAFFVEVDDGSPTTGDIGMAFVWQQMPGGGGAIRETWYYCCRGFNFRRNWLRP